MPWTEASTVTEREKFILEAKSGLWKMTELCERFGITPKTGYKWLKRYDEEGPEGLEDRSRAPKTPDKRMDPEVEQMLLELKRKRFPSWGARKVLRYLERRHPELPWPVISSVHELFKRNGLVQSRRRRQKHPHPGRPYVNASAPNDVWTADFKGHFRCRNNVMCYPLTVADLHTRYLLDCRAKTSTEEEPVISTFRNLFQRHGLPRAILTDNGVPFCNSVSLRGLSRLNVFWMQLGIQHLRTELSSPQQNGAHERMHRTLKAEATKPPANDLLAQQRKFDRFRRVYNRERPHESLDDETPADRWVPSQRSYPKKLYKPEYPSDFKVRLVSAGGHFRFHSAEVHLTTAMIGHYIGLQEIEEGIWNVFFYDTLLGRFHVAERKVRPA